MQSFSTIKASVGKFASLAVLLTAPVHAASRATEPQPEDSRQRLLKALQRLPKHSDVVYYDTVDRLYMYTYASKTAVLTKASISFASTHFVVRRRKTQNCSGCDHCEQCINGIQHLETFCHKQYDIKNFRYQNVLVSGTAGLKKNKNTTVDGKPVRNARFDLKVLRIEAYPYPRYDHSERETFSLVVEVQDRQKIMGLFTKHCLGDMSMVAKGSKVEVRMRKRDQIGSTAENQKLLRKLSRRHKKSDKKQCSEVPNSSGYATDETANSSDF
jgi:hypothetical protein